MKKIGELKWDSRGLLPAVVQDATTGEVLTVAYMSRESLAKTRELGETVFFSRSRQSLWHKGKNSGHYQKVVSVLTDCDQDAIVVRVHPQGPACHTGARSCFFEEVEEFAAGQGRPVEAGLTVTGTSATLVDLLSNLGGVKVLARCNTGTIAAVALAFPAGRRIILCERTYRDGICAILDATDGELDVLRAGDLWVLWNSDRATPLDGLG